ncbi:MAG: hypothetical protein WBW26_07090, partial [Bradyrhizobium sp.]|uniref:hypothetical protein n=1 Tax=Bradyrhizobium sp. TaxID=376 RepID=UPI003C5E0A24
MFAFTAGFVTRRRKKSLVWFARQSYARRCDTRQGGLAPSAAMRRQCRLKYCTARSCFSAAARDLKVPR